MSLTHQSSVPVLTPVQAAALSTLEHRLAEHHVAVLTARPGMGKTQILRALFARTASPLSRWVCRTQTA